MESTAGFGSWREEARVAPSVARVPTTRRRVVRTAQRHGVGAEVSDALAIVVGELVGNAVQHARPLPDGRIAIAWGAEGDDLRVEVTDGGADTTPSPSAAELLSTSGRGLRLVGAYAKAWGAVQRNGATTVWAQIPCVPPAPGDSTAGGRRGTGAPDL